MTVYTDSAYSGVEGAAYNGGTIYSHPSHWPTPYRMDASETEYLFHYASTFTLSKPITSQKPRTGLLRVSYYGGGDSLPIFGNEGVAAVASDFTRVSLAGTGSGNSTKPTTSASTTSDLWLFSQNTSDGLQSFFGWYGLFGDVFGVQVDAQNLAGGGTFVPTADRQFCTAQSGWVIYSPGGVNPVDYYGGAIKRSAYTQADLTTSQGAVFYTTHCADGVEISYLDGEGSRLMVFFDLESTNIVPGNYSVHHCEGGRLWHGVMLGGGSSSKDGSRGFTGLAIRDNYWRNIGAGWISTEGDGDIYLTGGSYIRDNVANQCCQAYSTGAIYLNRCYGLVAPTWDSTAKVWTWSDVAVEYNTCSETASGHFWPMDGRDYYNEFSSYCILWQDNFSWGSRKPFINNGSTLLSAFHRNIAVNTGGYSGTVGDGSAAGTVDAFQATNSNGNTADFRTAWTFNISYGYEVGFLYTNTRTAGTYQTDYSNNVGYGAQKNNVGDFMRCYDASTVAASAPPGMTAAGNFSYRHQTGNSRHWRDSKNGNNISTLESPAGSQGVDNSAILALLPISLATSPDRTVNYARLVPTALWAAIGAPSSAGTVRNVRRQRVMRRR